MPKQHKGTSWSNLRFGKGKNTKVTGGKLHVANGTFNRPDWNMAVERLRHK